MKKKLLLAGLMASSVVLACQVIDGVSFDINLGPINPANIADMADEIQDALGDQFGRDVAVSGVIRYQARLPIIGLVGGLHSVPLTKGCDQTFEERWKEIYMPAPPRSGGGGGGYVYIPRIPYIPGGCIGNCGGTVEVGDIIPT